MLLHSIVHKKVFFQSRKFSDLFVFTQSGNLTLTYRGGGDRNGPQIYFVLQVFSSHPDFMKSGDFF